MCGILGALIVASGECPSQNKKILSSLLLFLLLLLLLLSLLLLLLLLLWSGMDQGSGVGGIFRDGPGTRRGRGWVRGGVKMQGLEERAVMLIFL